MKESFIFYASFFEAICELDDKKRLKMYDLITKFALKDEEPDKINGICKALFALIKPQILANNAKMQRFQRDVENGKKGSTYGKLGGRPKKNNEDKKTPPGFLNQNPPENPINENENVNVNENVNNKENLIKEKTPDPFVSKTKIFFIDEYEKTFNTKPFLSRGSCMKLSELSANYQNLPELIPKALSKLKDIDFKDIDFTPSASWLLKGDNFERVMNGEFDKKTKGKTWQELLQEKAKERGLTDECS